MMKLDETLVFEELPFHLGLKNDDVVFISSDVKRFARNAKSNGKSLNIHLFVENLQTILSNGTLIFPAYTDYLQHGETFDYAKSKPSTGAISNKVFKNKSFTRTLDVLHSAFVWGNDVDEVMKYTGTNCFGEDSVFAYLNRVNAKFLFFDVHIVNSFTFVHYVEEKLQVPYRRSFQWIINRKMNGETTPVKINFYSRKFGVFTDFDELNRQFFESGSMKHFDFNGIAIHQIEARAASNMIQQQIHLGKPLYRFNLREYFRRLFRKVLYRKDF